jgi:hypothetical protein
MKIAPVVSREKTNSLKSHGNCSLNPSERFGFPLGVRLRTQELKFVNESRAAHSSLVLA